MPATCLCVTGPLDLCEVDALHKAEIQCCKGPNSEQCLAWGDDAPCPMSHPALFCRVCTINKFAPLEIATLVLAVAAVVGALAQAASSYCQVRYMRKSYELKRSAQRDGGVNGTDQSSQPGQPGNPATAPPAASTTCAGQAPVVIKLLNAPASGAPDDPEGQALLVTFRPHSGSSLASSSPGSSGSYSALLNNA